MTKIRLQIIFSISLIILCVGLIGCASNKNNAAISKNQPSDNTEANVTSIPDTPNSTMDTAQTETISGENTKNQPSENIETNITSILDTSQSPTEVAQVEPSAITSEDSLDTIDYNQYLKKIWVVKKWNSERYNYPSFYITKMENGVIEGKFKICSMAIPDVYMFRLKPSKDLGDLSGTVNNAVAECQFSDKVGNKGNVTLVFKENDVIEATVVYTDKGSAYDDLSLDGKYLFRPYNLTDYKEFTPDEEHSFAVELNSWGSVNFVSGEFDDGDYRFPVVYLTNEHDDILYEFSYFHNDSIILEASIKDINNDGLKDICIITGFRNPDMEHIEWIFLQMDDGVFYISDLDEEINDSGEDTDMD